MHLLMLIGPPGSGKSTVARALQSAHGLRIIRLREISAARMQRDADFAQRVRGVRDMLGWLPDGMAIPLMHDTLTAGRDEAVLVEGYPGNAAQTQALAQFALERAWPITGLELRVDARRCAQRIAARTVCPACDPDRHRPARATASGLCGDCGVVLVRRSEDSVETASQRITRYRQNVTEIRRAVSAAQLSWYAIDACRAPEEVTFSAVEKVREQFRNEVERNAV